MSPENSYLFDLEADMAYNFQEDYAHGREAGLEFIRSDHIQQIARTKSEQLVEHVQKERELIVRKFTNRTAIKEIIAHELGFFTAIEESARTNEGVKE